MRQVPAHNSRAAWAAVASAVVIFGVALRLHSVIFSADPSLCASIDTIGAFLAFTFTANALVRTRGTRDLMSLILAVGFGVVGLMQLALALHLFQNLDSALRVLDSLRPFWLQSNMLLAEAMLLAAILERPFPHSPISQRKAVVLVVLAGTIVYAAAAFYLLFAGEPEIHGSGVLAQPLELLPAFLFLLAAGAFFERLKTVSTGLDKALAIGAWMNAAAHLVHMASAQPLDAPFTLAQIVRVSSYAVVLGGTLLDNSRLFKQVQQLAISDPLTGLVNYRHLIDVLESEIERSGRTGREFSVLLLDLDGLKGINDRFGHLAGSRALCRLADVLRVHSRAVDTPARYGGDEFALVMPETGEAAARRVASRIRERLVSQAEEPKITVSVGVAVYPSSGITAERLLMAADEALYAMKQDRNTRNG
ncbi:MAG TPA: GGDEF domain-containing protein [Candidatus Acidoferrales bacterium]|jgi:diguanylate cyclase (GGDEF)-like protein|nr:GGDEF domain-containing protein [Candidatus Acidoferrales bacterium]